MSAGPQEVREERTKAYLRMWLTPGLGLAGCHRLLAAGKGPGDVFARSPRDIERLSIRPEVAEALISRRSLERAEEEWDRTRSSGIRVLDLEDPDYPSLLKEIFDPPIVLYARYRQWDPGSPRLAVVGTRRPSSYGRAAAERLAGELADRGIVVASGLARGIDTAAHRGAMRAGRTLAVLGTGIDRVYPSENRALADSIVEKGALLSEFPLGTQPLPHHFPLRNRILAGLTLGTVVVEARERSGSLITARLALEANREVFAVPGPIDDPRSHGPNQLIRQGACLVTGPDDIVEELPQPVRHRLVRPDVAGAEALLPAEEKAVLEKLSSCGPTGLDTLLTSLDLAPSAVYSALLALELRGLIRRHPGDRYGPDPLAGVLGGAQGHE